MHRFSWLGVLLLLQACALSSTYQNRPVIEDKVGDPWYGASDKGIGTLAITAERKVVVVNFKQNRFCTEPPQDFGQAINAMAEIVAAYKREKPKDALGTTHDANLTFKNSMETTLKEVVKQPMGILFLRYQTAFLCQMYANDALGKDDYYRFAIDTMDKAYALLGKEVDVERIKAIKRADKETGQSAVSEVKFSKPRLVIGNASSKPITTIAILDPALTKAFSKIEIGFKTFGALYGYQYKVLPNGSLIGNKIAIFENMISPKSGAFSNGDYVAAAIRITPAPNYEPLIYKFPKPVVFYEKGKDAITLNTTAWTDFDATKQLTLDLPKHVKDAYDGFDEHSKIAVTARSNQKNNVVKIEVQTVKFDGDHYIISLSLTDEQKKVYDALHKISPIMLKFNVIAGSSKDVPAINGALAISQASK